MEKNKPITIKQADYNKICSLTGRIYNTLIVLDYYCESEQIVISPIINNIKQDADTLNAYFMDLPEPEVLG